MYTDPVMKAWDRWGRESLRNGNVVFRSAGLPRSEPVQIGDWKNLGQFPLTFVAMLWGSACLLDAPITLDQRVHVPGDDSQGLWDRPAWRR